MQKCDSGFITELRVDIGWMVRLRPVSRSERCRFLSVPLMPTVDCRHERAAPSGEAGK